jgi:hypothetical protein
VREIERIIELGVFGRIAQIFQNTHPFMAGRLKQSPDAAENARNVLNGTLKALDEKIGSSRSPGGRASDRRRLHALRGARVRRLRAGAAGPEPQEPDALVHRVQGTAGASA